MAVRDRAPREGDQLRAELLAAATVLAGTPRPVAIPSLRAVARACGVSATAVYRHFPSQSALMSALLTAHQQGFELAVLAADDAAQDPVERLRRLCRAYLQWGLENPGMYQLLFESADQVAKDVAPKDTSEGLTARVAILLGSSTGRRPRRQGELVAEMSERLWYGLHGLVSLRVHKPTYPWTTDAFAMVDRLVADLDRED